VHDRWIDNTWIARSIVLIAILLSAASLYLAREIFVPVAFAVLLTVSLRPIVRMLERARLPTAAGATIVTLALLAVTTVLGWGLSWPVQDWVDSAPKRLEAAQARLDKLRQPVQRATEVVTKFENAAQGNGGGGGTDNASAGATTKPAAKSSDTAGEGPKAPPLLARTFGTTTSFLSGVVEVVLLLYLLLASGDLFARKLMKLIPRWRDKSNAVEAIGEVEAAVLRYLLVTLLINVGQGIAVGLVMWWLGVPGPLMWALLTVVLEFIPYLGATVMVAMLAVVGFAAFDSLGRAIAPPLAYLVITTLQNNVVSPYAYGNRLKLNPVAVLVGVLVWWFLWGIAGAFLAVPIIATIKIIADRTEGMRAVGEFLGE
jgi:predicted PurR-regulated permease PerM